MSGGFMSAAAHFRKKNKEREPPSDEEGLDHAPDEVIRFQKLILLKHLTASVKQSTDSKVTFNTVGFVCWIGIVPYTIFLYEAIVIAAKNTELPLSHPSTSAIQEAFNFRLPYSMRTASISSTLFTTSSYFLLLLFRKPIVSFASGKNVKIGASLACTNLQICKDKYLETEIPLCFATDETHFIDRMEKKSPFCQPLLEIFIEMPDTMEYLTQCSLPISILLFNNYLSKAVRNDTTVKKTVRKRKASSSKESEEESEMQPEDDIERVLSLQLKSIVKKRNDFKPLIFKKD